MMDQHKGVNHVKGIACAILIFLFPHIGTSSCKAPTWSDILCCGCCDDEEGRSSQRYKREEEALLREESRRTFPHPPEFVGDGRQVELGISTVFSAGGETVFALNSGRAFRPSRQVPTYSIETFENWAKKYHLSSQRTKEDGCLEGRLWKKPGVVFGVQSVGLELSTTVTKVYAAFSPTCWKKFSHTDELKTYLQEMSIQLKTKCPQEKTELIKEFFDMMIQSDEEDPEAYASFVCAAMDVRIFKREKTIMRVKVRESTETPAEVQEEPEEHEDYWYFFAKRGQKYAFVGVKE